MASCSARRATSGTAPSSTRRSSRFRSSKGRSDEVRRSGMKTVQTAPLWLSLLLAAPAVAAPPYWTLIWSDEFDGPAGAAPDASKWVFDLGAGGWGNHELEEYTNSRDNSHLDGSG